MLFCSIFSLSEGFSKFSEGSMIQGSFSGFTLTPQTLGSYWTLLPSFSVIFIWYLFFYHSNHPKTQLGKDMTSSKGCRAIMLKLSNIKLVVCRAWPMSNVAVFQISNIPWCPCDIWSTVCGMLILLIGRPHLETSSNCFFKKLEVQKRDFQSCSASQEENFFLWTGKQTDTGIYSNQTVWKQVCMCICACARVRSLVCWCMCT